MTHELSKQIKEQSVIKNRAKREIERLKEEMILLSPYKVGDEVDTSWSYSVDDKEVLSPGDRFYKKLKIKKIVVITVDGGETWRLGYLLSFANSPYTFSLSVPTVKGKKRKWRNSRQVFFEEDFIN